MPLVGADAEEFEKHQGRFLRATCVACGESSDFLCRLSPRLTAVLGISRAIEAAVYDEVYANLVSMSMTRMMPAPQRRVRASPFESDTASTGMQHMMISSYSLLTEPFLAGEELAGSSSASSSRRAFVHDDVQPVNGVSLLLIHQICLITHFLSRRNSHP